MSYLQGVIQNLPFFIQKPLLKLLYLKNGQKLNSITRFHNALYLYQVNGFFVPSETLAWYVSYEYYQTWVDRVSALAYKPKRGDIILDVGAGLGEECLVYSKLVGEEGSVFCLEANPEVFSVLKEAVKLNKIKNVFLFNEAISIEDKSLQFSVAPNSFIGGGIGAKNAAYKSFNIPGIRMGSFLKREGLRHIDFMKVNIEGAERYVIGSIGDSIKSIKNLAISCHDFRYRYDGNKFFETRKLVETYLKENHFEIIPDKGDREFEDWVYATNKAMY